MKRPILLLLCVLGYSSVSPTHAEDAQPTLWDATKPVPRSKDLDDIEGMGLHVIKPHEKNVDGYDWLHGIALAFHDGRLVSSFGHNPGRENTASEVANGRASSDGGKTWGPLFPIADGPEPQIGVSHGVFLEHGGKLWAYLGAFTNQYVDTHTRAYVLDDETGKWEPKGVVVEGGFWPTQEPLRMDNGNWIMAGMSVSNPPGHQYTPPAVAISRGDDPLAWDLVILPTPQKQVWGEATVVVDGPKVTCISRYGKPIALVSESRDYGRTWSAVRESNLPMAASKPYAGTLSTGQRYLIGTTTADAKNRRSPLTIAVSRPGEESFSKIFRIRDAVHEGPGESHPKSKLSYPYAVERDGKLYVAFSNSGPRGGNRNSGELAVIPIESLKVD
ncbi:hypothetical protein Pan216_53570 [Planctomycetes bacterium Pan216]|uniref:Sialidase domain-containing protein n=1 Tax=Kolteria novifilia TaxID=2527975 RepID=A0A518BBY9_9BACT|nr:hypothetical protein Pan216_53570 [Planctomycetes bacterium Pan216]